MEQEKQEAPVQQKKKRLSTPLLIFIILMAVTAVLCAVVAGIWLHGRSSLRNGGSAPTVTPGGTEQLDSYTVLHDGKYYRYQYGDKHIDETTGEQLTVDNVIFQYCHGEFRDSKGYMAFDVHGGWEPGADLTNYKVQVFTGGKMVEGTWSRYSDTDPALYVDADGNPIRLNRGKTWVCLIWNEHADDVVLK